MFFCENVNKSHKNNNTCLIVDGQKIRSDHSILWNGSDTCSAVAVVVAAAFAVAVAVAVVVATAVASASCVTGDYSFYGLGSIG